MNTEYIINNCKIQLMKGDITDLEVDAIVNAANAQLILGGGVAGAIKVKGGPTIQEECLQAGGTYVGGAIITGAGKLKSKYVIHAVGPRMGEGNEDTKLENAIQNSLQLVVEKKLRSVAFPAISTGIFGFPIERCAKIMIRTSKEFIEKYHCPDHIIFCLWGEDNFQVFNSEAQKQLLLNN
jgi:O-acetyl-ADP-ribose deacetylase (regulator of RNase III)